MKLKILSILSMVLFSNSSFAASPEIWWAIRVDCNQFMGHLNIHLEEKGGNAVTNSYTGYGTSKYETLKFEQCTNDDDSISCVGSSDGLNSGEQIHLKIDRRSDGTFVGKLNFGRGGDAETLGCLLSR